MGLHNILKQLQKLTPDKEYTARSRRHLLSMPFVAKKRLTLGYIFGELIQSGTALALTGVLFLLLTGTITISNLFSPSGGTNLDPVGLKAEAQAVDLQIQLTNLSYAMPVNHALAAATPTSGELGQKVNRATLKKAHDLGLPLPLTVSSSSATSSNEEATLTIDEVLDVLAR